MGFSKKKRSWVFLHKKRSWVFPKKNTHANNPKKRGKQRARRVSLVSKVYNRTSDREIAPRGMSFHGPRLKVHHHWNVDPDVVRLVAEFRRLETECLQQRMRVSLTPEGKELDRLEAAVVAAFGAVKKEHEFDQRSVR